jgi:hypothetical protein
MRAVSAFQIPSRLPTDLCRRNQLVQIWSQRMSCVQATIGAVTRFIPALIHAERFAKTVREYPALDLLEVDDFDAEAWPTRANVIRFHGGPGPRVRCNYLHGRHGMAWRRPEVGRDGHPTPSGACPGPSGGGSASGVGGLFFRPMAAWSGGLSNFQSLRRRATKRWTNGLSRAHATTDDKCSDGEKNEKSIRASSPAHDNAGVGRLITVTTAYGPMPKNRLVQYVDQQLDEARS